MNRLAVFLILFPLFSCFTVHKNRSPSLGVLKSATTACELDPVSQDPAAIIVRHGSSEFIYPEYGDKTLKFTANTSLDFLCPGQNIVISGTHLNSAIATGACVTGSTFLINGSKVTWNEIKCSKEPLNSARYTGQRCTEGGKEAEIGFDTGDGRFLRTIRSCFDDTTQNVIYTTYNLTSTILQKKTGVARPSFSEGTGFFNVGSGNTVNKLYTRATQRVTINTLLSLNTTDVIYIHETDDYYLSRGHLTARGDFFYPCQENSTFYYINAAPQWQTFNGKNWEVAESDVTKYASANKADLQVWTGTHGVATLPNAKTGKEVPLYLYTKNNSLQIPVPEIYWKLVYNPTSKKAIVLIGINNPYQTDVSSGVFCEDQSTSINWLAWKKDDIQQGYSYACTYAAFKKAVKTVPTVTVSGLLT